MEQKVDDQDVLLVKEKNDSRLKAVKGFDENGKMQTELHNQANDASFLKIERFGNLGEPHRTKGHFRPLICARIFENLADIEKYLYQFCEFVVSSVSIFITK